MTFLRLALMVTGAAILVGEACLFFLISRNVRTAGGTVWTGLSANLFVLAVLGGSGGAMILLSLGVGMPETLH
jgi:hypothetical protein